MKKIFTLAAAVLASFSLWATPSSELSFSEPTELPEGYVYSKTNTPIIATVAEKSAIYVTNGGGGAVSADCFTEEGLDASKGKRWIGFITDDDASVVFTVLSSKKTWNLYQSDGTVFASFANTASSTWEEWTIENLPAGAYILTTGNSQCYLASAQFSGGAPAEEKPVSKITISGKSACYIGEEVTLTAKPDAANATIWWTNKFGEKLSEEAKLVITPDAEGEFTYTAWAENELNEQPVTAEHTIVVTEKPDVVLEGVIIPLADQQVSEEIYYSWAGEEKLVKNKDVYVEIPAGDVHGDFTFVGSSVKDRRIYIYSNAGTEKDESRAIIMNPEAEPIEYTAEDIMPANKKFYLHFKTSDDFKFTGLNYIATTGEIVHNPSLKVSAEQITLAVTASEANPSAKVVFSGKYLTPGEYALSVPNFAGLSVDPISVTVGEDGLLNAEVTIAFASEVEVEAAITEVSLTIDELTAKVSVTCSAKLEKAYISQSLNIEQLVLDNGLGFDIRSALAAANIEFANIDQLDSLNDEKANRNYPFLGLKLKKANARLACWLKAGETLNVKFGNVGEDFLLKANGAERTATADEFANLTPDASLYLNITPEEDTYLEIICNSTKTLVIKQLMLNEEIAIIELPESPEIEEGVEDIQDGVQAVKVLRDGQLLIRKGDVLFNANGAIVK